MSGTGTGTKSHGGVIPSTTAFNTQLSADMTNVFFNQAEFADPATYMQVGGMTKAITICYGDEDPGAMAVQPPGDSLIILVKYSDISAPLRGDKFWINAETWYLEEVISGGRPEGLWHIRITRSARRNLGGGR